MKKLFACAFFALGLLGLPISGASAAEPVIPAPAPMISNLGLRLEDALRKDDEKIAAFHTVAVDADAKEVVAFVDLYELYLEARFNLLAQEYLVMGQYGANDSIDTMAYEIFVMNEDFDALVDQKTRLDDLRDKAVIAYSKFVDQDCKAGDSYSQCMFEKTVEDFIVWAYSKDVFQDQ